MALSIQYLDWPAPAVVKACYTLRSGGGSCAPFDSFNLAEHVGDKADAVARNRAHLSTAIGQTRIHWLEQVHGKTVIDLDQHVCRQKHRQAQPQDRLQVPLQADASTTRLPYQVCVVMTADCLPVFFCDPEGRQVAIAHAGWRSLAQGVLQNTLRCFSQPASVRVYLGPAISQAAFEVGDEVKQAFVQQSPSLATHFMQAGTEAKWMADLYGLARSLLQAQGVYACYGGDYCTYGEDKRFFSYRRDGQTGRMASMIWIEPI